MERALSSSRDSTERHHTVEALKGNEVSFGLLFDTISHAVWVYDADTLNFLLVNNAAVRHYGYNCDEFLSLKISDIHVPNQIEEKRALLEALDPDNPSTGTWQHRTKDGRILEVEGTAHAFEFQGRLAVLEVSQDVTERKRLETELAQAQKLESVGQLAAGIAHEINTPIQYVGDNLRFLQEGYEAGSRALECYAELLRAAETGSITPELLSQVRQTLDECEVDYFGAELPKAVQQSLDGIDRVATIVRAMKEFAHPGYKKKVGADLNKAIANALIVSRNEIKYVADVETDLGELPLVMCHIGDLNQVFLNLLINSADAIREVLKDSDTKGLIRVSTRHIGNQVVISISDSGCGIPEGIRDRVFDPFFTTKPVGRGSGQGLAIARTAVVDKHGGSLRFERNEPQGTTFIISLPIEPAASPTLEKEEDEVIAGARI